LHGLIFFGVDFAMTGVQCTSMARPHPRIKKFLNASTKSGSCFLAYDSPAVILRRQSTIEKTATED
jgi:hypothetical protein